MLRFEIITHASYEWYFRAHYHKIDRVFFACTRNGCKVIGFDGKILAEFSSARIPGCDKQLAC